MHRSQLPVSSVLAPFSFDSTYIREFNDAIRQALCRHGYAIALEQEKLAARLERFFEIEDTKILARPDAIVEYATAEYSTEFESWMFGSLTPEQRSLVKFFYGYKALEIFLVDQLYMVRRMFRVVNHPTVSRAFGCALINNLIPLMQQYFFKIYWLFNDNLLYRQNMRFSDLPIISIKGNQPDLAIIPQPLKTEILLPISPDSLAKLVADLRANRSQLIIRSDMPEVVLDDLLTQDVTAFNFVYQGESKKMVLLAQLMRCFYIYPWFLPDSVMPYATASTVDMHISNELVSRVKKLYFAELYENLFDQISYHRYTSFEVGGLAGNGDSNSSSNASSRSQSPDPAASAPPLYQQAHDLSAISRGVGHVDQFAFPPPYSA